MPTPPAERLLDALVEIIAERGMEAVSVRSVAAAAGVSIGAVQHHFPTKDAMLLGAMERVGDGLQRRLERIDPRTPPGEALRTVVLALAALSRDDRPGIAVWLAFVARACTDEAVAARHREYWQAVEALLTELLAAHHGAPAEAVADVAAELLALADGVAIAVAVEPGRMPAARARAVLGAALDRALGGPPP